jgi:hypothetical protein
MWKLHQRADFVGDLFRTRRRREKVLLSSVDEHLARKRSSQLIPKVSALPPPPPPPTPVEVEVAQQAAPAGGPKHTVSMRGVAAKAPVAKRSYRTRTLALALTAAALAFVAARVYPLDRIAYDAMTPFVPPPIVIVFPKPSPAPAVDTAPAEETAKAEEKPVLVASADEKPKHAAKGHAKHAKSEAALPPWLRHGHR